MRPPFVPPFDPRGLVGWRPRMGPAATSAIRSVVHWSARHPELRAMLLAILVLVLSWRVIKRSLRVLVEVLIALVLLGAATRLGWLAW